MIGIDLTRISRFENASESFIEKILHENELLDYSKAKNKARFLAKRWSVKEALFKADNKLKEFSLIELKEKDRVLSFDGFEISTSTEDDYYIAIVKKEQ